MTTLTIVLPDWAYFGIAALLAMNLAVNAMLLYFKRKLYRLEKDGWRA